MSVTYIDEQQKESVKKLLNYVLKNFQEELSRGDFKAVYYKIFGNYPEERNILIASTIFKADKADVLGKFTELLLDSNIDFLKQIDTLEPYTFFGCSLRTITIPKNIKILKDLAFYGSKITTINYLGNYSEWKKLCEDSVAAGNDVALFSVIDMGSDIANTVTIKCADGTIITPSSRTKTTTATDEELFNNKKTVSEAMTKKEVLFKRNVLQYLSEEGFPTFAKYLKNFHFNFLTSEEAGKPFVAAISSARGIVLVNPNVDADAISMLLRHEAGHDIFKHNEHLFAKLKKMGIDTPSELAHDLANRAGDYHISNLLYDEDDYYTAKHINVDGEVLAGLVTELDFPDHPEYWTMDFDQLWDVFVKNYSRDDLTKKALDDNSTEDNKLSDDYVEGYNRLVDDYNAGKITKEQISRWLNAQGK